MNILNRIKKRIEEALLVCFNPEFNLAISLTDEHYALLVKERGFDFTVKYLNFFGYNIPVHTGGKVSRVVARSGMIPNPVLISEKERSMGDITQTIRQYEHPVLPYIYDKEI